MMDDDEVTQNVVTPDPTRHPSDTDVLAYPGTGAPAPVCGHDMVPHRRIETENGAVVMLRCAKCGLLRPTVDEAAEAAHRRRIAQDAAVDTAATMGAAERTAAAAMERVGRLIIGPEDRYREGVLHQTLVSVFVEGCMRGVQLVVSKFASEARQGEVTAKAERVVEAVRKADCDHDMVPHHSLKNVLQCCRCGWRPTEGGGDGDAA